MNIDRPRVPIGGGKTVDTTREVTQILDAYLPMKQKTLFLSILIADFAKALEKNPSRIVKQFYDRIYGKENTEFVSVQKRLLIECAQLIQNPAMDDRELLAELEEIIDAT